MQDEKLKKYHAKRDFNITKEPKGGTKGSGNSFVVQKHAASHLHYDFRLEIDGVLKSWAVPKGIPTKLNEKRLAVETEDHPLEYAHFEGTIPKGQYGAGTVKIWDSGTYEMILTNKHPDRKTMTDAIKDGAIKIFLKGKRYKGPYALARFKTEHNQNQWLIFKIELDK
jgi:DNA ligase D-like protein (predicted 3'-phosphoesterase)